MAKAKWECIKSAEFDGDILITDPCYLKHGGSKYLEDFDNWEPWVEKHGGLINRTYYGDWGCTVFKCGPKEGRIPRAAEELGEFCADAGTVCVVKLDDVLKESPKFMEWLGAHLWCGTVIRGFKGKIKFITKTTPQSYMDEQGKTHNYNDIELHIRGDGEIDGKPMSFESKQTSL